MHELAGTAKALLGVIDKLHDDFLAAPEAKQGQLPIYKMTGITPIKNKGPNGATTNYAPKLELVEWVDRPVSLGGQPVVAKPAVHLTPVPAATGSTQVTPPSAKATKKEADIRIVPC